ncbi:MAG: hypothetical protein ACI8VT_004087, partial [Saprospiraceae bacterium]
RTMRLRNHFQRLLWWWFLVDWYDAYRKPASIPIDLEAGFVIYENDTIPKKQ